MKRYEYLYSVLRTLRQELPTKKPVFLERLRLTGMDGYCIKHRRKFSIQIDRMMNEDHAVDVLLHEYAHALTFGYDGDDHGMRWGKAYSKVYRCWARNFGDEDDEE